MGMWAGIRQGQAENIAEKFSQEKMDLTRRQEERLEEQFSLTKQQAMIDQSISIKSMLGGGGGAIGSIELPAVGSTSKSSKANFSADHMIKVLTQEFELDENTLTEIYSQGGTRAAGTANIKRAYEIALKYNDKWKTGEYTGEVPSVVLGNMLNNAIRTNSVEKEIDWDTVNKAMGVQINDEVMSMVGDSYVVPGVTSFMEPALIEKPTLAELKDANRMGVITVAESGLVESRNINNRIAEITKQDTPQPGDIEEAKWLTSRLEKIKTAQAAFKNDVFSPLIELYGTTFIDSITDYYGELEGAPLNPAFTTASQIPIDVTDEYTYGILVTRGYIKPLQRVTYLLPSGERVTEIVGDLSNG
tara:strand:- start:2966 stop:4045 length:1080 start_codon:yes stop_codon:yes gene_type:complete